jgi:nucleoside-diphosphate-sugar epimerase
MKKSKKINVVILGATGFIGRNLALKFCADPRFSVSLVHHKSPRYKIENAKWVKADLRNLKKVKKALINAEIILQAAATTSGANTIINSPEEHVTDNAIINSLVLREAFQNKSKHVVFFSCTTMYRSNSNIRQKETDFKSYEEIFPNYFGVAVTKLYVEKLCEFYSTRGETKFTVIRHSNIYGPWDKYDLKRSHVMGASITKVMQAENELTVWGDGDEIRDLLYVDDLVNLVEKALSSQKNNYLLINAGSDEGISVINLVRKIATLAGKTLTFKFDNTKPTLKFSFICDSSKALKELNWRPEVSLDQGILKSIEWWNENHVKKLGV